MAFSDKDIEWFLQDYSKEVKQSSPCYEGVCWAMDTIEKANGDNKHKNAALERDSRDIFIDLYAFAVEELGKEAVQKLSLSIQKSEERRLAGSTFSWDREKAFWCKREIQRMEAFKKKWKL